ncbi:MAG: G1 family glutamic endopeptidase [Solirubrobacteraceae bacterium]
MHLSIDRRSYMPAAVVIVALGAVCFTSSALAAGSMRAPGSYRAAPNHKIDHSTSTNWSGYAVSGLRYTSVSASWTQPAVNCSLTPTGWSSFWVGLDGDTSNTVEQTGTEADCSSGKPVYSAWYEMYPKFPHNYANTVLPGDHFTASVTTAGRGSFTLTLTDTGRWTQTTIASLKSARLSSAEVIAEAPSSSRGVLPLADFASVGFSGATVNGSTLTSSTAGLDPITMVSGSTVKASPSLIKGNGSFTDTWQHQ